VGKVMTLFRPTRLSSDCQVQRQRLRPVRAREISGSERCALDLAANMVSASPRCSSTIIVQCLRVFQPCSAALSPTWACSRK